MNRNRYLLTNLLSEEETRVITSIVEHIEKGERKVGIQQIASENYVSATFIMKMCKRLGFDGYSELFYHLSTNNGSLGEAHTDMRLENLIDNYSEESVKAFCDLLFTFREQKLFAVGGGFSAMVAGYMVERLSICGFVAFNSVHFYDMMLYREQNGQMLMSNVEPSFVIAISQSGEADIVINDVKHARQKGYQVVSFMRKPDSTLARLSDIYFIVDGAKQTLIGGMPNPFFGKVILAFEELMAAFFQSRAAAPDK